MKKKPSKQFEKERGLIPIIGTMACESNARRTEWLKNGCNAFDNERPMSRPMSFWLEQDVLKYLKRYEVPYPSVYGEIVEDENGELKTTGCERTGCMYCAFGCNFESEPNRFQKLKETHPRQYEYCIGGGEFVWEGTVYTSSGKSRNIPWINDDGSPMSDEEIEEFVHENENDENYKFVRKWQPSKNGLGLSRVLDYIGVKYE